LYLIISVIKEHEMADYFDLLKTRRSIRDFEDSRVPLDIIREIIKESCLAPSSGNGQPWRFVIVNNRELIKRLSDESKKNILCYIEKNPAAPMKKYEEALRNKDFNVFYNAPCLIYILGLKEIGTAQIDCTLAASYLMFSAAARGLGTCWVALGKHIQDPGLLEEIGMPKDCEIVAPVIVGYPRSIPDTPERMEPKIFKIVN
jgi:nitroreductase